MISNRYTPHGIFSDIYGDDHLELACMPVMNRNLTRGFYTAVARALGEPV